MKHLKYEQSFSVQSTETSSRRSEVQFTEPEGPALATEGSVLQTEKWLLNSFGSYNRGLFLRNSLNYWKQPHVAARD